VVCLLSCAETLYLSYVAYLQSLCVSDRFHYLCSCCWSTKPEYTFLQFFGGPMISVTSLTRKPFITVYHWPPRNFLNHTFMFFFLLYLWGNSTNLVSCCSPLFSAISDQHTGETTQITHLILILHHQFWSFSEDRSTLEAMSFIQYWMATCLSFSNPYLICSINE